ncbi:L-idonate 5-dehydrogenase (plasmid) [Deinococcus sp. KNUC1210]|uniref:L-idonate 5-dehydrogenase n=1 Tax=Deinococcus sp. KNUC1210 TaxID=2917691 RepID=UPI001EEFDA7C|nr:L-idonate 5-dehydrogenase [Deinococcus sp. KNUC1210]ULH14229.1 L-idonate 5-dehydrogenase [Deinococcus sp. KNUC1210]
MKALRIHAAHDLRLQDLPEPEFAPDEALIRLGAGGICGSDLHYYAHGGVGDFRLREAMTLGHEVAGDVVAVGAEVTHVRVGDRVAVNPSRPCLHCEQCLSGHSNLCPNMRFFGSAARFPHVQGAFAELFTARQDQCVVVSSTMSYAVAACAEPLAVTLHAVSQAGPLLGGRVLIVGAGPIGVLLATSARLAGATQITVTDLQSAPLRVAEQMGATETVNVREQAPAGLFDVAFEASGSPAGLASALGALRPGGRLVQVGMLPSGPTSAPLNPLISREITVVGSFRFHREFGWAAELLGSGRVDVTPILSASFPLSRAQEAFELAADRERAVKVSLLPDEVFA